MDFHHPLFRSLALPLVLAFAAAGLLRGGLGPVHGRRWASAGTGIAIVVASVWLLGWDLWPRTLTEELPWIYMAAALLGLGLEAMRAATRTTWLATCVLWTLVLAGLSDQPLAVQAATWLVGIAVIAAVLGQPPESAHASASLVIAGLGLAVVAFVSGSALLFELSLSIAAAVAGCALWLWPVARIAFGACGAVVSVIAWLAVAEGVALLSPVRPLVLLLLACAFLSGPIVQWAGRWLRQAPPGVSRRKGLAALIVAVLAAIWVTGAVALAWHDDAKAPASGLDDPYYTPRW
ncbi:hypothetical protein QTH90_19250 [Variovorax sp. J2P1-59]|uniref:hypothetical protein n=1 Tax=Variovorax flavidus TaxID=3053501 RepID=UPI0025769463|nr:hypothetical protein [Variovorax sp. J2P1-59]MDM0076555.1 hypothetical protein [Variovorax sp. J2P1-59]